MITGFNTDVEYEGVTYHVQTEDKGVETPLILSLVYHRGTILASKRSPYEDLLNGNLDEKILAARLQKQHKLICAALRGGRLEDLKKMTVKDSAARKVELAELAAGPVKAKNTDKPPSISFQTEKPAVESGRVKDLEAEINQPQIDPTKVQLPVAAAKSMMPPVTHSLQPPVEQFFAPVKAAELTAPLSAQEQISRKLAEKIDHAKAKVAQNVVFEDKKIHPAHNENNFFTAQENQPIPRPHPSRNWQSPPETITAPVEDVMVEAFEITEADIVLPAEAVAVIGDFTDISKKSPEIGLLNETEFKGGDRKTVSLIVWRGTREDGIADAQVMVKVLGSSFRPMIFHARTDANGVATVHLQLPHFRSGRAAILIRAITGGEEIEMRRVISHG